MPNPQRALAVFLSGLLLSAVAVGQQKSSDDADLKEVHDYVLTADKLQRFGGAMKALQELQKSHPEVKDDSDAGTLDLIEKKLQKYPEVVAVLSKNGFAPREFAVCSMTLIQVAIAVGSKKAGAYKEYPPEMLKVVSKANLDFGEQNWDEIQKVGGFSNDKQ